MMNDKDKEIKQQQDQTKKDQGKINNYQEAKGMPNIDKNDDEITEMINEVMINEELEQPKQEEFLEPYEKAIDELEDKIHELEVSISQQHEEILRKAASIDNIRKKTQDDINHIKNSIKSQLLQDFTPIIHDLQQTLNLAQKQDAENKNHFLEEGIKTILNKFSQVFEKHGIEVIDALNKKFDPTIHEAMGQQPDDSVPPGTVIMQWQKGYKIGEKLIRPARVIVSTKIKEIQ